MLKFEELFKVFRDVTGIFFRRPTFKRKNWNHRSTFRFYKKIFKFFKKLIRKRRRFTKNMRRSCRSLVHKKILSKRFILNKVFFEYLKKLLNKTGKLKIKFTRKLKVKLKLQIKLINFSSKILKKSIKND